jgi:hypothetical protein
MREQWRLPPPMRAWRWRAAAGRSGCEDTTAAQPTSERRRLPTKPPPLLPPSLPLSTHRGRPSAAPPPRRRAAIWKEGRRQGIKSAPEERRWASTTSSFHPHPAPHVEQERRVSGRCAIVSHPATQVFSAACNRCRRGSPSSGAAGRPSSSRAAPAMPLNHLASALSAVDLGRNLLHLRLSREK